MSSLRTRMIRLLQLHRKSPGTITALHVTASHVDSIRSPLDLLRMPENLS